MSSSATLHRRPLVKEILKGADDNLLVIGGLGSSNWDITDAGDRPLNMPLWGAMGAPLGMGLGLALAQPSKRVLVVTAHPDDSEFGAGGTVAKLVWDGAEVSYVIATNGTRTPTWISAKKSFRIATIVITRDRLLNDDEMSILAKFYSLLNGLRNAVVIVALILVVAAVLLVGVDNLSATDLVL